MKKRLFTKSAILALAMAVTVGFTACDPKEDELKDLYPNSDTQSAAILNANPEHQLIDKITEDITLKANEKWVITGGVHVMDGVTLTIEEGVTLYANADETVTAYLIIEKGGKIMAEGTADNPIVFTSGVKAGTESPGDWGGLIINGDARINEGGGSTQAEMGGSPYGGTNDAHNGGIVKYVRLEYTGDQLSESKQHNGLTLNGVGSETVIEYVQAYKGNDDGFEFFGGTVSPKYLVSTGSGDDCFDWTYGWRGVGQYWIAEQSANVGERGFEGDNNGDDNTLTPFSFPTIANVTLIGGGGADQQAMKLREGTKANIINALIVGFGKGGIEIQHNQTIENLNNGDLKVSGSVIESGTATGFDFKYSPSDENPVQNTVFLMDAEFGNAVETVNMNKYQANESFSNFKSPANENNELDAANYVGAINTVDWTAGWTKGL